MSRVQLLKVHPSFFLNLCKRGIEKCQVTRDPLPADAWIESAMVETVFGVLILRVQSDTYPDVPSGHPIPDAPIPWLESGCPHRSGVPDSGPPRVTLSLERLQELLYDLKQARGAAVTLEVQPDGTALVVS